MFVVGRSELQTTLGFEKIGMVGRGGFELPTFRLSVERSSQAELPAPFFVATQS